MTPEQFKHARKSLGLSLSQLGHILDTDPRTIRRWEANDRVKTSRPPNPMACRILGWMLDGFKPPQWPK